MQLEITLPTMRTGLLSILFIVILVLPEKGLSQSQKSDKPVQVIPDLSYRIAAMGPLSHLHQLLVPNSLVKNPGDSNYRINAIVFQNNFLFISFEMSYLTQSDASYENVRGLLRIYPDSRDTCVTVYDGWIFGGRVDHDKFGELDLKGASSGLDSCRLKGGIAHWESSEDLPSYMIGDFVDDYDIEYQIAGKKWSHLGYADYNVAFWNEVGNYLLAFNDAPQESFDGLWTRIDWIKLDTPPYEWAFCISIYDAESLEEARKVEIANPDAPMTGCNGFPYSRMKRIGVR